MIPTAPTVGKLDEWTRFLAARFAITDATTTAFVPVFNAAGVLTNGNIYQDASGNIIVGRNVAGAVGGATGATFPGTAIWSAYGPIYASASGYDAATFVSDQAFKNVVVAWNTNTQGLSVYRVTDAVGAEAGAFGHGNSACGAPFQDYTFVEASDFTNTSVWAGFRLVQTKAAGTLTAVRIEINANGDIGFYDQVNYASTQAALLTIKANGDIVPGAAALATNATAGFQFLPTCAGTPSGTPTTYTGRAAMVYDTTAHKIWVYDGGAWKATAALI